jgi:hypothetical protein
MDSRFSKYLEKRNISKVTDPGDPRSESTAFSLARAIQETPAEVKETPITQIITDIGDEITVVSKEINDSIDIIYQNNKTNGFFTDYFDLSKEAFFDPRTLRTNKNLTPKEINKQKIFSLERQVFQRSTDPRAPFIKSLFDTLQEVYILDYLKNEFWDVFNSGTSLFETWDNEVIRYSLYQQSDYLVNLRYWNSDIQNMQRANIQNCFLNGIVELASVDFIQLGLGDVIDRLDKLSKSLKSLKSIDLVLNLQKVELNQSWENTRIQLETAFTPVVQELGRKIYYNQVLGLVSEVSDSIFDALSISDSIGERLMNCIGFSEFTNDIEKGVLSVFDLTQQYLSEEVSRKHKVKENQSKLLAYAIKNSNLQATSFPLDPVIKLIDALRSDIIKTGQINSKTQEQIKSRIQEDFDKLPSYPWYFND